MIWSCKARPCIHDYNYLEFPFHFQLCKMIMAITKYTVKINFSYQKNKGDNSSSLCIKLSFLMRLICFCSLFVLRDWIQKAIQQSNLHIYFICFSHFHLFKNQNYKEHPQGLSYHRDQPIRTLFTIEMGNYSCLKTISGLHDRVPGHSYIKFR